MVGLSPLPLKDEESSSRGCEPAKVYIKVKWGYRREIILHSAEVPMDVLAVLLRSVKTSQPATRRQRRPGGRPGGRKGEGCKKRRQEARQDTFRAKLSPSAEEFKSARPLAPRELFYNKPMKSYPYCGSPDGFLAGSKNCSLESSEIGGRNPP